MASVCKYSKFAVEACNAVATNQRWSRGHCPDTITTKDRSLLQCQGIALPIGKVLRILLHWQLVKPTVRVQLADNPICLAGSATS